MQNAVAKQPNAEPRAPWDTVISDSLALRPMFVFSDHQRVPVKWHGSVYAIGNFDGLHVGHQALIQKTVRIAEEIGAPAAVLTFDPHPRELFDPSALPFRLATSAQKTHELTRFGTNLCLNQRFDLDFAALKPADFVDCVLLQSLQAAHLVVGSDFRFGCRQSGNTELLKGFCNDRGIGITVIDNVKVGNEVASSTLVRRLIAEGGFSDVTSILGRPWSVTAYPATVGGQTCFNLSDYTKIKVGAYKVRIGGYTSEAVLDETAGHCQVLAVQEKLIQRTDNKALVEFVS